MRLIFRYFWGGVKGLGYLFLFSMLTLITQVGGLIWLLSLLVCRVAFRKIKQYRWGLNLGIFLALYLIFTLLVIPPIARYLGRVPLPIVQHSYIRPLTIGTCLLNRHYVRPELLKSTLAVSNNLQRDHPHTIIAYLDASFPFWNGFPLLPHLSHDDGKKLDIALFYRNSSTGEEINASAPSFIGYGAFEGPREGEVNTPERCRKEGYWQYSFLQYLVPHRKGYTFDLKRTRLLVRLFAQQATTRRIFIEPHLKQRLSLRSPKIRFHGCKAVRHDDHIHVEMR